MKKPLIFLVFLLISNQFVFTQGKAWIETDQQRAERMKWWTEARFGMFIHWGISSEGARGEWLQTNEQMTNEEYHRYFDIFEPDLYDPREWAKAASDAGMKYVVITAKHHDGFCLWDSRYTDFKSTNTPLGLDLLKPFVEAFRDEGLLIRILNRGLIRILNRGFQDCKPTGPLSAIFCHFFLTLTAHLLITDKNFEPWLPRTDKNFEPWLTDN